MVAIVYAMVVTLAQIICLICTPQSPRVTGPSQGHTYSANYECHWPTTLWQAKAPPTRNLNDDIQHWLLSYIYSKGHLI